MSANEIDTVNLASLKLVKTELQSAIDITAKQLEKLLVEANTPSSAALWSEFLTSLQQISGTLSLVQLRGADLLTKELYELAKSGAELQTLPETFLETLASGLFILPRYVDYVMARQRGLPDALLPVINEVRQQLRKPLLPESYFYQHPLSWPATQRREDLEVDNDELQGLLRRFRHMYQVGLVAVLQNKSVKPSLGMMQRAVQRSATISKGYEITHLWQLADFYLTALMQGTLALTSYRKRLFGALDRELKRMLGAADSLAVGGNPELERELLFLVAISQPRADKVDALLASMSVNPPAFSDQQIRQEIEALRGPNAATVSSLSAVLQDELHAAKDILERASQAQGVNDSGLDDLVAILKKLADILPVVGLTSTGILLKENLVKVQGWRRQKASVSPDDLLAVADTLLYVESRVAGLKNLDFGCEVGGTLDAEVRHSLSSRSQYEQAQQVVFAEMESGLTLIKRALNSFSESNYDRAHIKNVAATLTHIRGGMAVMEFKRAAKIVACCADFIEDALLTNDQPAVLQQMLETFADAIISIEYYVDTIQSGYTGDDKVLDVAEESLAALGYRLD